MAPKASLTAVQGGGSGTDTSRRPPYPLPHSGSVNNASSFNSSSQIDMRGTGPDGDDSLEEGELSEASYSNPQSPMEGKCSPPYPRYLQRVASLHFDYRCSLFFDTNRTTRNSRWPAEL